MPATGPQAAGPPILGPIFKDGRSQRAGQRGSGASLPARTLLSLGLGGVGTRLQRWGVCGGADLKTNGSPALRAGEPCLRDEPCSDGVLGLMCQRPSKAAQVWPSKIAHLAEVTSL